MDTPGSTGSLSQDEAALLEALRSGDDEAYETLLHDFVPRLLPVARRIMGNEHDAHDVLQDAFLSAFKAIGQFSGQSRLSTWLHRIVVNAALMKLRSRRRRPEVSIEGMLPKFDDTGRWTSPTTAWTAPGGDPLLEQERRRLLSRKLEEIPEDYRIVLILRDIEQHDTRQTAEALGISSAAVKTRLHRARQALRGLLEEELA